MRNLKKFLALVLAMMMAFSLMLTANAKTTGPQFDDVKDVTPAFEEAVDVLVGMKVFQGDEEANTFRPGDTITRAEVAAIIYRLATGDVGTEKMDLYTTTHPFTDVGANDWFAGYVGYCWNAGYIKGTTATTFNPYDSVTGYEVLAMVLRAMGYDANDEFTGTQWIVNVSATATQRNLLKDVKTTHYGNTLYLASRRDVVASILFQAAQATRVKYTPAFGYQTGDHTSDNIQDLYDDYTSLGLLNFGLWSTDQGVVIGNQQTGEKNTRLGFRDYTTYDASTTPGTDPYLEGRYWFTPYTWANTQVTVNGQNIRVGNNDIFNVETGIDLFGHNIKIWYDCRPDSYNNTTGRPTYAYYDKATKTEVVKADNTLLAESALNAGDDELAQAAKDANFELNSFKTAVFSNSFSKFGSTDEFATPNNYGIGQDEQKAEKIKSPVKLYKLIANGNLTKNDDQLDVVISLNIETSRITESNAVNRVPTIGVPVGNDGSGSSATVDANDTTYIDVDATNGVGTRNVKLVGSVNTGVVAKDALVGNSTSTLGDYEFGVHITGTSPRTVSSAEKTAINNTGTETAYFLMAKVTPDVTGKVVAFNVNEGTVVLDNGTTLHRSKYYNTVVNTAQNKTRQAVVDAPNLQGTDTYALPQSIDQNGVESYNPTTYKFYIDFEGNYLGAERVHDSGFIYGTYLDYDQKVSSSTFTYYLTGVDLNGEVVTKEVTKYWGDADPNRTITLNGGQGARDEHNIMGTNDLGVPFRDTMNSGGQMNYIGKGVYRGFTLNGTTVDPFLTAPTINLKDYFVNMERIGVYRGVKDDDSTSNGLAHKVVINKDIKTLGAVMTEKNGVDGAGADSNLYFTEDTKFIVVDGYGTDTVTKTKVYNGLTELLGSNDQVTIDLNITTGVAPDESATQRITKGTKFATMTYFQKSPYIYAQSGAVSEKVDVVILPKLAVETSTSTSSLYYMGDPNYSLISSHEGKPVYQYTIYKDGMPEKVWLTNLPDGIDNDGDNDDGVFADSFLVLGNKSTTLEPTTGGEVYTATFLDNSTPLGGVSNHTDFTAYNAFKADTRTGWPAMAGTNSIWDNSTNSYATVTTALNYSATTRNAQAATFTWTNAGPSVVGSVFLRVAEAGVTNLNATNAPSKQIWPGITDLATLNEAGSINPVTGRPLKVAAQLDPSNPLVVTHIYVCWDQTQP